MACGMAGTCMPAHASTLGHDAWHSVRVVCVCVRIIRYSRPHGMHAALATNQAGVMPASHMRMHLHAISRMHTRSLSLALRGATAVAAPCSVRVQRAPVI